MSSSMRTLVTPIPVPAANRRRHVLRAGLAGACLLALPVVRAQPARSVRLVVGFPAGGAVDVVARQLAEALRAGGYTAVVENRPGAAGKLAIDAVKAAAPDGETLMVMPNSIMTMEPALFERPRFDVLRDFAPVSAVSQNSQAFAVSASIPPRTLRDFLNWAQANPARATFATPGQGTPFEFLGITLSQHSGVALTHVPYRGGAQALPDVISGQVSSMFSSTPNLVPFHQRGQLRVLAVSSPARLKSMPDVPTFAQAGYAGLGDVEQFGVFAPGRTPTAVLDTLAQAIATAVANPALREAFAKVEFEPVSSSPSAYTARLREELRRWEILIRQTGHKRT